MSYCGPMSVHPVMRQNFAGKRHPIFYNISDPIIYWFILYFAYFWFCWFITSPCSYSLLWIVLLDTRWTLWSTTAWGYLWCSVITDYTHTVSVVPCVVEQSDLVMFYEGRSAITADCQLMGNFPLKPIFLQLDWFITILINQCINNSWVNWIACCETNNAD